MKTTLRRTWAEINLDNLIYNYRTIRAALGENVKFLGVVKADAYGHGAVQVARVLEEEGAEYLAVSNLDEARDLRNHGIVLPILLLGYTPTELTPLLIANRVTQAVYSEEAARGFSEAAKKCGGMLRVHIKLDTGMSRLGFQCDEAHEKASMEAVERVCALPALDVEGAFMHFAVSDEDGADNERYTRMQYERFSRAICALGEKGVHFPICHCANSGAVLSYREYAMDMVRPGILLYGLTEMSEKMGLKPVMTLKTTIGSIKEMEAGTDISYGRTYETDSRRRIAVIPIGYADGFFRSLSNNYSVLTEYGKAPIRGRICMDMCMIDVTDLPDIKVGDEVEIFGEHLSCDETAKAANTIPYELICAVSKRVPREYLRGGKIIAKELWIQD
jgi:alanine racemase